MRATCSASSGRPHGRQRKKSSQLVFIRRQNFLRLFIYNKQILSTHSVELHALVLAILRTTYALDSRVFRLREQLPVIMLKL